MNAPFTSGTGARKFKDRFAGFLRRIRADKLERYW